MMINPADRQLVKQCLEAYWTKHPQFLPGVPVEMRQGDPQEDWSPWKLVPSRLTEADIFALEADLPFLLPPLFRAYLVTYFVLGMDFGEFHLPEIPSDNPLRDVERYLFQSELWPIGYAQFAGGVHGDPVCFDLKAPTPDGDFPVVIINHDSIASSEDWKDRAYIEPHAIRLADSFRVFFTKLCSG